MVRAPSLFVSSGQPPLVLLEDSYSMALRDFGQRLGRIKAIVSVSSHWVSPGPIQITSSSHPKLEKNFYGFQDEIYELQYPAPGDPELASRLRDIIRSEGLEAMENPDAGIDHGVWMPLLRIKPQADVPVIQISLPQLDDPRRIMQLGHALGELREEGILLMGSGAAAFNPAKLVWSSGEQNVNRHIRNFDLWLQEKFQRAQIEDILNYRKCAPGAEIAHPVETNLLPLFFIMGTSLNGDSPGILYRGYRYESQSLLSLTLGDSGTPSPSLLQH